MQRCLHSWLGSNKPHPVGGLYVTHFSRHCGQMEEIQMWKLWGGWHRAGKSTGSFLPHCRERQVLLMGKETVGPTESFTLYTQKVLHFSTFFFFFNLLNFLLPITIFTWSIAFYIHRLLACFPFGLTLYRRNTKQDLCSKEESTNQDTLL